MTDFTPDPVSVPGPIEQILAGQLRHLMTIAATLLVSHGILSQPDTSAFIQAGTGLIIGLAGFAWSAYQKHNATKALVAAINAPAAKPPVTSPPTKGI